MSKKTITDENGKKYTVKEKKPFYKRWWFWLIVVIIAIGIFGSAGSSSKSKNDSNTQQTATNKTATNKNKVFKLGQTATHDNVDLKVNNVKYANSIGQETPQDGNQFAIVNVTLKNNSNESKDYNTLDFKIDNNGDIKDSTCISSDNNDMQSGEMDKGASITKDVIFEIPNNADKSNLKLVYEPSFFNDNLKIRFALQ